MNNRISGLSRSQIGITRRRHCFSLEGLTKVFRSDNVETTALNNINIEIKCGEFVAVMGPSGCGKSTLLNIIGMLDNPTSGSFWFNGEDVAGYGEKQVIGDSQTEHRLHFPEF